MFANDHIHIFVTARRRRKKIGVFFEGANGHIHLCDSPPQAKKIGAFSGRGNGHIQIFVTARRRRKKIGGFWEGGQITIYTSLWQPAAGKKNWGFFGESKWPYTHLCDSPPQAKKNWGVFFGGEDFWNVGKANTWLKFVHVGKATLDLSFGMLSKQHLT